MVAAPDRLVVTLSRPIRNEQFHVLYRRILLDYITQRRNQVAVIRFGPTGDRVEEFESDGPILPARP
jgi:hypothetical protein